MSVKSSSKQQKSNVTWPKNQLTVKHICTKCYKIFEVFLIQKWQSSYQTKLRTWWETIRNEIQSVVESGLTINLWITYLTLNAFSKICLAVLMDFHCQGSPFTNSLTPGTFSSSPHSFTEKLQINHDSSKLSMFPVCTKIWKTFYCEQLPTLYRKNQVNNHEINPKFFKFQITIELFINTNYVK